MSRNRPNIATSCPMMEYKSPRPGRYPNSKVVNVGMAFDLLRVVGATGHKLPGLTTLGEGEDGTGSARCWRVSSNARTNESGIVGVGFCGGGASADIDGGTRSASASMREFKGASTSSPTCFRRSSITDDKKSGLSG